MKFDEARVQVALPPLICAAAKPADPGTLPVACVLTGVALKVPDAELAPPEFVAVTENE